MRKGRMTWNYIYIGFQRKPVMKIFATTNIIECIIILVSKNFLKVIERIIHSNFVNNL